MENRAKALKWWHSITYPEQKSYAKDWLNSLGKDDFRKEWTFQMISTSSNCIENIYNSKNGN